MEEQEIEKQTQENQTPVEQPQFDWKTLGVEEFKGEETINQLKSLIDKGKSYDEVVAYKSKYEDLNSYYDTVSNPTKYFAEIS